jgi:hypothetical protein
VFVETVIKEIEEAFRGVPLGNITLHEAEVMDGYGTAQERAAARARDTERDWSNVPDASIRECPAALSYVDPVSWRFYWPAYARYELRHPADLVVDSAVYALGAAGVRQREEVTEERFGTLNAAQVRAVCSFLEFASQNGDWYDDVFAKEALDDYWRERRGV